MCTYKSSAWQAEAGERGSRHLPQRIKATVILVLGQIIRFERLHRYMSNMYQYMFQNMSKTVRQVRRLAAKSDHLVGSPNPHGGGDKLMQVTG